nr:MAG TPA: Mitochondrial import receptor subunit Tom6, fungal [Caudoviricetes sp.]
MKKQYSLFIHSAFFDILLPQKVRQEGLSETHAHGEVSTMLP